MLLSTTHTRNTCHTTLHITPGLVQQNRRWSFLSWSYCTLGRTGAAAAPGAGLWSAGVFLSMIFFWKACKLALFLFFLASPGIFFLFLQHIMASSVSSTKLNLYENLLFELLLRLAAVASFCTHARTLQSTIHGSCMMLQYPAHCAMLKTDLLTSCPIDTKSTT